MIVNILEKTYKLHLLLKNMDKLLIALLVIALFLLVGCNKSDTSIDLTNCKSYFDGCNGCNVENGKITSCTEKFCDVYSEPKCTEKNRIGF